MGKNKLLQNLWQKLSFSSSSFDSSSNADDTDSLSNLEDFEDLPENRKTCSLRRKEKVEASNRKSCSSLSSSDQESLSVSLSLSTSYGSPVGNSLFFDSRNSENFGIGNGFSDFSNLSYSEATFLEYEGPFEGEAVAVTDSQASPYDRQALRYKKGDTIQVIQRKPSGAWIGKLGESIGHFKCINVRLLNLAESEESGENDACTNSENSSEGNENEFSPTPQNEEDNRIPTTGSSSRTRFLVAKSRFETETKARNPIRTKRKDKEENKISYV